MFTKDRIEFGSQAAEDLLIANGLVDLDSVFDCGDVIPCRHTVKGVSVATLQDGDRPVRVYIKKQWRRSRWIPRMPDLRAGKAFWSYPLCEWRGLLRFREIGLETAEPLALFRHPWHPCLAAVVTQAVPCPKSLRLMVDDGTIASLDTAARATLADAIATIVHRIHDARLGWRSMDIKHFYPARRDDGSWRIWLIDAEGVHGRATPHLMEGNRRKLLSTIRINKDDDQAVQSFAQQIERHLCDGSPQPTGRPHRTQRQSQTSRA